MQLKYRRSIPAKKTGMFADKRRSYRLDAKLHLTPEEMELATEHGYLQAKIVEYDGTDESLKNPLTKNDINNLLAGVVIEDLYTQTILARENEIVKACKTLQRLLAEAESFDGTIRVVEIVDGEIKEIVSD